MSYGLVVLNAGLFVQIDDNYSNYSLVQSGFATTNTTVSAPSLRIEDLVFVRIPSGKSIGFFHPVYNTYTNPSVYTLQGFGLNKQEASADFVYEYRIFKQSGVLTPTVNSPFQVFKPNGQLAFDAALVQPRIRTYTLYDPAAGPVTLGSLGQNPWIYANSLQWTRDVPLAGFQTELKTVSASVLADFSVTIKETTDGVYSSFYTYTGAPGKRSILLSL